MVFQGPPAELAKHVLAEVPKQVTDYYKMRGMAPKPRPAPGSVPPPGAVQSPPPPGGASPPSWATAAPM